MKKNVIQQKSFAFALRIITLYQELISEKEFVVSKQLLRSGTSIGANVEEALGAFSKKDFLYKMTLALKEGRETNYWLRLLQESNLTSISLKTLQAENFEIVSILSAIVKTSKKSI